MRLHTRVLRQAAICSLRHALRFSAKKQDEFGLGTSTRSVPQTSRQALRRKQRPIPLQKDAAAHEASSVNLAGNHDAISLDIICPLGRNWTFGPVKRHPLEDQTSRAGLLGSCESGSLRSASHWAQVNTNRIFLAQNKIFPFLHHKKNQGDLQKAKVKRFCTQKPTHK